GLVVAVIERLVITQVDEKLRRGRVWIRRACHGQRAALVLQIIVGFIGDRAAQIIGRLVCGGKAAALDDETRNDAMKNRAVIKVVLDVLQEIGGGFRRLVRQHFNDYVAIIGV